MKSLIGAMVGVVCLVAPAMAETPSAIVEDVQGKVEGVEFMDYVTPGKVIKIPPKSTLVLSYLKSCMRETITGAVALVGTEQSTVQLGDVQRVKVPCDGKAAQLSEREANQSAATTFRTVRADAKAPRPVEAADALRRVAADRSQGRSQGRRHPLGRADRCQGAGDLAAAQERHVGARQVL